MNERIRQLAEQAVKAVDNPFPGNPLNDELAMMYIPDCFAEKFAELIVAECLGIVDDAERGGSNDIWDNAVKFIRRDLQEHFGVE
jgi:hypothetical protein